MFSVFIVAVLLFTVALCFMLLLVTVALGYCFMLLLVTIFGYPG
jgi:hypothetical protein